MANADVRQRADDYNRQRRAVLIEARDHINAVLSAEQDSFRDERDSIDTAITDLKVARGLTYDLQAIARQYPDIEGRDV